MFRGTVVDVVRVFARQWWRLALAQLIVLVGMSAVVLVAALIVQNGSSDLLAWISSDAEGLEQRAAGIAGVVVAVIAVFTLPLQVAGIIATVRIADRAIGGRRPRALALLAESFGRVLPLLASAALAVAALAVALVAAPLIVLVGLLGLAATGVIALIRRRRSDALPAWPGWRTWGFCAIPFAVLWRVAAPAILMPVAVVLEPTGPLRSVRAADRASTGRRWTVLGVFLAAVVVALAVSVAATTLGSLLWAEPGAVLLGGLVQLVALPVPVVAAAALYRRAADLDGRALGAAPVSGRAARSNAVASPIVARIAAVTVAALVLSIGLSVSPILPVAPAEAAPTVAGSSVAYVVRSNADDVSTLAAQQASCLIDGAGCTFRAALTLAQQAAADAAVTATITFGSDLAISLTEPLTFAPDTTGGGTGPVQGGEGEGGEGGEGGGIGPQPTPTAVVDGTLTIDAGQHRVALDGGDAVQLLDVRSEYWDLAITGLSFSNGYTSSTGGALLAGVEHTTLDRTVFESNSAFTGGGAVAARDISVSASSFLGNQVTGYFSSARGGALSAITATVVNSTFQGNGVGDQFTTLRFNGSDIYADSSMDVLNSTFVNYVGNSLNTQNGVSTLRNSLFTSNYTGGGAACIGNYTGGTNIHAERDTTCPGTVSGGSTNYTLVGARDDSGRVPVFPLTLVGNPAMGAGVGCPAVDALGTARPATGCDLGAVEFNGKTSVAIEAIPSATQFGAVTFRATVTASGGSIPAGTVTFTVGGIQRTPVALTNAVADLALTGFPRGPVEYSAVFTPAGPPLVSSTAGPLEYVVEPVSVTVALDCADPQSASCPATPWAVDDSTALDLVAAVADDRAGSVVLALDPQGTNVVAGPTPLVDGRASFGIDSGELGLGTLALYAIYASDDAEHIGTSPARSIDVLRTAVVTLSLPAGTSVYGDVAKATATVTVTGSGATPTGAIVVQGIAATLDSTGTATIDASRAGHGTFDLTARYSGSAEYAVATSAPVPHTNTPASVTTVVSTVSPAAPRFGDAVSATVTLTAVAPSTADPEGVVRLVVDGSTYYGATTLEYAAPVDNDGTRVVTLSIPAGALPAGAHVIAAELVGGDAFAGSVSATRTVTVATAPTTTALTVTPSPSTWGDRVTLTATVDATTTAAAPTGSVRFAAGSSDLGSAALVDCPAPNVAGCAIATVTVSTSALGVGSVALGAAYLGAGDFADSSGTAANLVVAKATPTVTVAGSGSATYGDTRAFTVTVARGAATPADGTRIVVTAVPDGGDPIALGTVSLLGGTGTITVPTLAVLLPGTYAVTAAFAGDDHFVAASGAKSLTVASVTTDIDLDAVSSRQVVYGKSLEATVTVKTPTGTLAPEGDVVLSWYGFEVGRATLDAGDTAGSATVRTVSIDASFGPPILFLDNFWLDATFEAAPGFADARLSTDGENEERKRITITPAQAKVAVEMTAVLGQPVTASATVGIVDGEGLGITPTGSVSFNVTKGYAGDGGTYSVQLVNGRADLSRALNSPILVDVAGPWRVTAVYTPDGQGRLYTTTAPDNFGRAEVEVSGTTAVVTVEAPDYVELGSPLSVNVAVSALVQPTGRVRLQFAGASGNSVFSDDVTLVNGRATITTEQSRYLRLGEYTLFAYYYGDATLQSARSADFAVTVGKIKTSIVLSTSSQVGERYPGIVGAPVQYTAYVKATRGIASGIVQFYRGTVGLGQVSITDENSTATITVTADVSWSGDIVARYLSADGTMAESTATLAHSWVPAPVLVELAGDTRPAIGKPAIYTATVRYDWRQYPALPTRFRPQGTPTGMVTISDGNGAECSVWAFAQTAVTDLSTGSCAVAFTSVGAGTVTASFTGGTGYPTSGTATRAVTVLKGTAFVTLATGGVYWMGLTTIPVAWDVKGPASGTVTLKLGADVVCTSASLSGSCNVAIPRFGKTAGDAFTLEYGGNALWAATSKSQDGSIVACVPFQKPSANPAGSATVEIFPAPTCDSGTGYHTSDSLYVNVTAVEGYGLTGISDGWMNYGSDQVNYYGNNGFASLSNAHPVLRIANGQAVPFTIRATTEARCVPVTFRITGITDRLNAINALYWESQRACADAGVPTVTSDNSVVAYFKVDSTVKVTYQDASQSRTKFYGWTGNTTSDRFARSATFTITPDTRTITGSYGPICYSGVPTLAQPAEGTLSTSVPGFNCADPQSGTSGWVYGTRGTGQLVDSSTYGVTRSYFDSWGGNTSRFTLGAESTKYANQTTTTTRPFSFTITDTPFTVSAKYNSCVALKTSVIGDRSEGVPGTVTVSTAANCPVGKGTGTGASAERWYTVGTSVTVTTAPTVAKPTRTSLRFLRWSGLPLTGAKNVENTATFALTSDATATASYGTNANCRPFTLTAVPAGAITLDTKFSLGENACASTYGSGFYDQGISGNGVLINATAKTADAEGAEIVYAWSTSSVSESTGELVPEGSIFTRSYQLNESLYARTEIVAYACEFVQINANVASPTGALVSGAGATNITRTDPLKLGDYVRTSDANCSTGADPRSGYGGYAWLVGTQLLPVVVADPVAYRFTGWSGDAAGTGETPDAAVKLVGPGRTATGGNYHYQITANFQAICYTLSLPADADKLEVVTAPNCPGVAASEKKYLGGTAVVVHAADKGDSLFRHWSSGTDEIDKDDSRWASVLMTSDKTVIAYYSSRSAGEQIVKYGTVVGDTLAVSAKKLIGIAAAAVTAYVKTVLEKVSMVAAGIGYIAQGLELLGVHGTVIDGMKNASAMMTSMIGLLWAPFDCMSAWAAGGEDTAFYAAQNLVGGMIVAGLSANAQKAKDQVEQATTTLAQLKEKAAQLKTAVEPVKTAAQAIKDAKEVYDIGAGGSIGLESTAYDAWGSQAGASVFGKCMSGRAAGLLVDFEKTMG